MPDITSAGAVATPITTLRSNAVTAATAIAPGLTTNLPGSLIEDMASTAAGAMAVQDQAAVDLVNSVGANYANEFIITELGQQNGIQQGVGSNTSVYVVFSGPPGFTIGPGFLISDGTNQYRVQDAAVISGPGPIGVSAPTFCLATESGSWAVPTDSVTTLVSSVPASVASTFSFTNPAPGFPGAAAQTIPEYQAQVIQAQQAVASGIGQAVRTALEKVSGVQARLVSFRQVGSQWEVIVGGGDPYQVGGAIMASLFDFTNLRGASAGGTTESVAINDFPDTYTITFVVPKLQTVGMTITWNTIATANFVADAVVIALVQPAMVAYVNSIYAGKPMSLLELQGAFIAAISGSVPEDNLAKLQFVVTIDDVIVNPPSGGVLISGDDEGYFFSEVANIAVVRG